jgi:hypothetical protein
MVSRIDSDYRHLLNEMNCLLFHRDRIAYSDHPGPPLHMFLGIFRQIIYRLHEEVLIYFKIPVITGKSCRIDHVRI